MDKLQRWLKKKEEESPSPSLRANPTTLRDKFKTVAQDLIRTVTYIPQRNYNSLTQAERERQEGKKQYYEFRAEHFPARDDASESILRTRKEIVKAIKHPILYNHSDKRDNLDEALKDMKRHWQREGYEWELPRDKLIGLRKKAAQPEIAAVIRRLYDATMQPCMSLQDIREPFERLLTLHQAAELPFDENKVWNDVLSHYAEKAPTIPLIEVLDSQPGHYIVHGIPASGRKGSLDNNHVLKARDLSWRDFLTIALDHAPTLSCSSVTNNSKLDEFYSRVGVLVEDGRVYNAFPHDGITKALTPEIKIPSSHGLFQTRDIRMRVDKALNGKDGRTSYNELIVGSPKIAGLFYHGGRQSLGGTRSMQIPFLDTEEETQKAIGELRTIAEQRGLPLYYFEQGKGFVRDGSRELAAVA